MAACDHFTVLAQHRVRPTTSRTLRSTFDGSHCSKAARKRAIARVNRTLPLPGWRCNTVI